jgi:phosphoribosylamine--glycine ligase
MEPEWSSDWAVTVVLASGGYPESSSSGDAIAGLDAVDGAEVFHAGTAERDGEVVTAGGRVLGVTGLGATPGEARDRAYAAAERIEFDGRQLRTDIAARAVDRVEA